MADLIVIYDPEIECAAIVDAENRIALGPAMIGEEARELLQAWLDTIPYDVAAVDSAVLRDWYEQFAGRFLHDRAEAESAPAERPVEQPPPADVVAGARAEHEAAAAGSEPPPPAPADTDVEADQGEAAGVGAPAEQPTEAAEPPPPPPQPIEGPCPACGATGQVPGAEPGVNVACNLCHGTGQLTTPAPA